MAQGLAYRIGDLLDWLAEAMKSDMVSDRFKLSEAKRIKNDGLHVTFSQDRMIGPLKSPLTSGASLSIRQLS